MTTQHDLTVRDMQDWEKRIGAVLGDDNERSFNNARRYRAYLKKSLSLPVLVTGNEDFPWEEPYVLGMFDQKEYIELKKTNPSYKDTFALLDILGPVTDDVIGVIQRVSDGQTFKMELSWLRCVDMKSIEYVTLQDYSIWHTNY